MKLSLVMPAYNEQNTLRQIVEKTILTLADVDYELLIVDDGSKDKTLEIMKELEKKYPRIRAVEKEHSGKSQTVKHGILNTIGEYVVIQDADMEYDPADLLIMLKKIEKEGLDVVYGNRFGENNEIVYLQNWIGNTALSAMSALITGIRANMWPRDMEVCYKMAKGDLFRSLAKHLTARTNFGFEPEITAKFSQVKGIKFAQTPIRYYPRTIAEGKKMNAIKHGVEALREIYRYNFPKKLRSFVMYLAIGFTGLTLDFISFVAMVRLFGVPPLIANPISMSIGIINNFLWNAHLNFKKTDQLLKRFLMFYGVGVFGILLSNGTLYTFHNIFGFQLEIVKAASIILVAIVQFFLNSKIAFRG